MASNSFGKIFKITTWGESHGPAIGVVIDGCPAGLKINVDEIDAALRLRAPGNSPYTSPRKEEDRAQILSGVFEGETTGAPINISITNRDADSSKYEAVKDQLKPGHAHYTYLEKYGTFDYRGGGRSSGRETACRVAAGAVAKKLLNAFNIDIIAYIKQIGPITAAIPLIDNDQLRNKVIKSPLFCPDDESTTAMIALIEKIKNEGDSLGGIVEFISTSIPVGLGDPIYEKLEANLAYAMMGLPATKGFEIGSGFDAVNMLGSDHNDPFIRKNNRTETETNHAGGILGGISNGMPLVGRVAFKPTSSIQKPQNSINEKGAPCTYQLPTGSRHDPCVAVRAVPVVEAMVALVLADALLLNRCARVSL